MLLKKIGQYSRIYPFSEIIPLSARSGENLKEFTTVLERYLPEGPKYFPDDMVTDQPERNIVQEIVREKLLLRTREEVPHAIGVFTEEFSEREMERYISVVRFMWNGILRSVSLSGGRAPYLKRPGRKHERKYKI